MSRDSALAAGRIIAEQGMESTCTVTRATKGALNGLKYTPSSTVIYSGPCQLLFKSPIVREADVQGQSLARQEGIFKLPIIGSGDVLPDDIVTITANPLDAEQVGVTLVIRGIHEQTFSTARRFPVELVS